MNSAAPVCASYPLGRSQKTIDATPRGGTSIHTRFLEPCAQQPRHGVRASGMAFDGLGVAGRAHGPITRRLASGAPLPSRGSRGRHLFDTITTPPYASARPGGCSQSLQFSQGCTPRRRRVRRGLQVTNCSCHQGVERGASAPRGLF
jgi:hypothetical protein